MEPEFIVVGPDVPSVAADVQGPITLESVSIQGGVTNVEIGRANSASGFVNLLHAYIFRLVDIVCNIELWAVGPVEDAVLFADSVACGRALAIEGGAIIERIVWTSPRVGADLGIFISGVKGEIGIPPVASPIVTIIKDVIKEINIRGHRGQATVVDLLVGPCAARADAQQDGSLTGICFRVECDIFIAWLGQTLLEERLSERTVTKWLTGF
mmetsp:Transcript_23288/g.44141  ORF Transcript_23288/g.44141 Transcript_23288/m.44141 type:complete len:212 (+) Transcript_23288:1273-1908(+)